MAAREPHDSAAYVSPLSVSIPLAGLQIISKHQSRISCRGCSLGGGLHAAAPPLLFILMMAQVCMLSFSTSLAILVGGHTWCQTDTVNLHIHTHQLFVGSLLIY